MSAWDICQIHTLSVAIGNGANDDETSQCLDVHLLICTSLSFFLILYKLAKRVSKIIAVKVESEQHKKENEYNDPSSSSSSYTISVNVVCSSQHTFEMK